MTRAAAAKLPADAGGITDAGKTKTSAAVDALTAPPAVPTGDADRIVHIPTGRIRNHPHNRKVTEDDVADLVASIKTDGIINPLGVTAAADWNVGKPDDLAEIPPGEYVITAGGHRRLLAAELAKLPTVPCIVRADFAGAKGRRAALLENLHRQDLDAFQEAEAFAELTGPPYKLSQRDLASLCNVTQPHISRRLKLLKLPSTVREQVLIGDRRLGISDAVELARVADQPKLLDEALQKVQQWGWDGKQAVDDVIAKDKAEAAHAAAVAKLEAAGVQVLDRAPTWELRSSREPVRLDALKLKVNQHKKELCHAAYVRVMSWNGEVETTYACTKPARHAKDGESTVKTTAEAEELATGGGYQSDAEQRRERTALKKQIPDRIAAARRIVIGEHNIDAKTMADFERRGLVGLVWHCYGGRKESWLIVRSLGIVAETKDYPNEETTACLHRISPEWLHRALAVAYFENELRATHSRWGVDERFYLEMLTRAGYEISDVEHEKLGDKRSMAGAWVPPSAEEVAKQLDEDEGPPCRVCLKRAIDMDPGVTWVGDDLCSACSDAQDAGWVDPDDQPIAIADTQPPGAPPLQQCPACEGTGDAADYAETSKMCERCGGDGVVPADELEAVSA